MKITKRNLFAILVIAAVIIVLILSITREKTKSVPFDVKHQAFYEAMKKGKDRSEVEKGCITCHNPPATPLPKKHPPKEQCLICHKLNYPKQ